MKAVESTVVERVSGSDLVEQSRGWLELASSGPCDQPFFQPEWFEAFARSFEPTVEPIVLCASNICGDTVGVLPLMRSARFFGGIPARTLRSLSNIHSCRFDLIHSGVDKAEAVQRIWKALVSDPWWEVIEVFDVPHSGAFEELVALARSEGYLIGSWNTRRSPYVMLPSDATDPFVHCPHEFKGSRQRLKAKQRKLESELGQMELRLTTVADHEILGKFYQLESAGWKGENRSAIACDARRISFYTRVAHAAAARGYLAIYSLIFGKTVVAMHFGLEMNGRYYTPKVAYNERYRKHSPGLLLVHHVIADLVRKGVREFDFLGPEMEWKRVWTNHTRQHANWYIFRPGIKGRLAHTLAIKLAPVARRVKHRVLGDPQGIIRQ